MEDELTKLGTIKVEGNSLGDLEVLNKERKVDTPVMLSSFPSNAGMTDGTAETVIFYFLDLTESDGSFTNASSYYKDGKTSSASSRSTAVTGSNIKAVENVQVALETGVPVVKSAVKTMVSFALPEAAENRVNSVVDATAKSIVNILSAAKYKQTGDAIQMMMPPKIEFNTSAGWQAVNSKPTGLGLMAEMAFGDATLSARASHEMAKLVLSSLYEDGGAVASSYRGQITNPYTSQAFEGMGRRSFRFDWVLAPKNEDELDEINYLIRRFRFHAHPTLSVDKAFLKYPSQVDIIFKTRNADNSWLPKIATCVIKDVSVDYTPNGQWSALNSQIPGAPSMFNLSVTVEEIVPLVKSDIEEGF